MSYRKKYKYSTTIPKPSGLGWKSINGSQVWISKLAISDVMDDRNSTKIKAPSLYGSGSSIVRSALNFMMQVAYPSHQKYHIDWVVRIDEGLSREVFRADVIHSDLLGQNILETLDEEIYLIDWEYSFIGSPAYDLAIVTRGVKNPFKVSGGLDRLIDAYLQCGGQQVTKKDVHIHEILLNLGWYESSLDRTRGGHAPEYYLEALERLLNRASKGG